MIRKKKNILLLIFFLLVFFVVCLAHATGFTFSFHEGEDITFTAGSLNVADDGAAGVAGAGFAGDADADLGDVTAGTGAAEDGDDLAELGLVALLDDDFFDFDLLTLSRLGHVVFVG